MHRAIHAQLLRGFETVIKRRKTFTYLKSLEQTQWATEEDLAQLQLKALNRLLDHAFAHCNYYRQQWLEKSLHPDQVQTLRDFRRWPLIDRTTVRANRKEMRADLPGMRLISKSTGGSTGEPVHFDLDQDSNDRRSAAALRGYSWAGAGPGTRQLHLWGVPLSRQKRLKQWKDSLYHQLHHRRFLSTFGLGDEHFGEYFYTLNHYRPDTIVAYTNSIYEFARMIQQRGLTPFKPESIVVGAEKLHPFQRELIEKVFATKVFETYGSREVMLIGAECEQHAGLHLTAEHLIVEILGPDGKPSAEGEEGDIYVTDLFNFGMPFIRYKTGDRAIGGFETCPCGRGLPLLKGVVGRSMDTLITSDGRRISGALFPHLMKDFPAVIRFQVVQDKPDHVQLRVVANNSWTENDHATVTRIVQEQMGPAVHFELIRVDEIPLTAAGKLRVVVNNCPGDS